MSNAPQSPIAKAKKWGKLKDPTKTPPTKVPADFESTFVKLENTWDPAKKEYTANVRLCVRLKAGLKAPKQLLARAWAGPGLQESQLFVYQRSNELSFLGLHTGVQLSLAATLPPKASTRSRCGVPNKLPSYSKSSAKSPRKTANVASPSSSHSTTTTK